MIRGIVLLTVVTWVQWVANPLERVSEGWVFLDRETIDTLSGGFHDEVTGVFVEVTLSSAAFIIEPDAGAIESQDTATRSGVHNGIPYRIVSRRAGPQPSRENHTSTSAQECENIEITFLPGDAQGASWHYGAVVCSDEEEARVLRLVFEKADDIIGLEEGPIRRSIAQPVLRDSVEKIVEGSTWSDTRQVLGPPVWSDKASRRGFLVEYELRPDQLNGANSVILVFNQDHRLREKRFE